MSVAEQTRPKLRLHSLDVVRGVCVLLVVYYHYGLYAGTQGMLHPALTASFDQLAHLRMPLLLGVSGFLSIGPLRVDNDAKLWRRIAMLLWLFVFWTGVQLKAEGRPYLGLFVHDLLDPHQHTWFLRAVAAYLLFLFLLRRVPRQVVFVASVALSLVGAWAGPLPFMQHPLATYLPYFVGGALYGDTLIKIVVQRPGYALASGLIAVAALNAIAPAGFLTLFAQSLLLCIASIVAGLGSAQCAVNWHPGAVHFGRVVGSNALPIYLGHVVLLTIATRFIEPVRVMFGAIANAGLLGALLLIGPTVVAVAACLAIHNITNRFWLTKMLWALPRLSALPVTTSWPHFPARRSAL